jgi:xanthine dehydrogenase YagR molybdenum-binding subunit
VGRRQLTARVSTQGVHGTAQQFAQSLKIPQSNVRVITQYMGGGFGSKFGPDAQGVICAKLAQEAKAPVKLMLDRKEDQLATGNRPSASARIRAGVSAEGRLTAFDTQSWGTGGASTRTSISTPVNSAPCGPPAIHKDASSRKS